MICHCTTCRYDFDTRRLHSFMTLPSRCPDCGAPGAVRPATHKEIQEYRRLMEVISREDW